MLTRKDLDASGCGTPDCGHDHSELYLVAQCHPSANVEVRYVKATGWLAVHCAKCKKLIVNIEVAA